ncbi:MAG: alpha/beta fold hydrolase [Deltaproteobacteria bacterium]|jgi:poly(3-hydroxyalkanoate) synthetase|nr:alpha/beta fold hydrolase [Deltaproteobacteria bacterium]MDX9760611.1 alpha/beta fold hydrolase [Desulfomonilia bacterium]HPW68829.1 alpha/beta fold hydrolase [Deltaproteobacteria bacterium]
MNTPYADLMKFFQTASSRGKPEFISPNRKIFEDQAVVLRRFDEDRAGDPILIVPPQAGHHSSIADYAPNQSLVQTCLRQTNHPVYVIEWKSSTLSRRGETIDDLVKQTMLCVKKAGPPVILAGLCQGGWLSAIYAALFPDDVRALMLAAAPIDFTAGGGKIQDMVNTLPLMYYQYLVGLSGGNMSGDLMLMGWKMMNSYDRFVRDYLNLWINVQDESYLERTRKFSRWYEYAQDISGRWYLDVVEKLFKQNRLIRGTLEVLCEYVDLQNISCPLALLAGERDDITLVPQVHNLEHYASTPRDHIFKAVIPQAGHISVFMGRRALQHEWPAALAFIDDAAYAPGARVAPADLMDMARSV